MICAYCKSDIDNDSFYCDQCSKEVFICATCGKPGKGKNCVEDGGVLFSPFQKSQGGTPTPVSSPAAAPQSNSIFSQPAAPPQAVAQPPQPAAQPLHPAQHLPIQKPVHKPQQVTQKGITPDTFMMPVLKLINNHLNIDIDIKDGAIIGRSGGDHTAIFSQFSQVSGKHAQFIFDKIQGWTIKDLGSTNGVAMTNQPNWQGISKLSPNVPVAIRDNTFLLVANIEFQIKIILPQSSTPGTQRI